MPATGWYVEVMSRRWRVIAGVVGIAMGAVGLLNILIEQRAANERQRVLNRLAEQELQRRSPVTNPDGSVVVWEGQTFRSGDSVRIRKWAGTFKKSDTGAAAEVHASSGHVGTVVRGEKRQSTDHLRIDPTEPIQILRVRWHPQKWKVLGPGDELELPAFEATIHVSHLEPNR